MKCLCSFADVDVDKPDEKSIMTYVAQFLKHYPNPHQSEPDGYHDEVFFQSKQIVYGGGSEHLRVIPMKQSLVLAKMRDFTRI